MEKLNISYKRTCNCKPSHINCLMAKDWVKSQVGIWELFMKKDIVKNNKGGEK